MRCAILHDGRWTTADRNLRVAQNQLHRIPYVVVHENIKIKIEVWDQCQVAEHSRSNARNDQVLKICVDNQLQHAERF